MALSSVCRSCGSYFKIREGKAVANKPTPINPFGNKVTQPPAALREEPESDPPQRVVEKPRTAPPTRRNAEAAPEHTPAVRKQAGTKGAKREIDCLACGQPHSIARASSSSLCPHCGSYVSLQNFDINGGWNKRIETRGDVVVGRKGHVHGVTVQCYNLTIKGNFEGGAHCSGELRINSSATISGRLQCKQLHVAKHAHLRLDFPARTQELIIDGTVEGDVECEGSVILKKHAILLGDLKAGSLVVHTGAHHNGLVHMTGQSIASQVSDALSKED